MLKLDNLLITAGTFSLRADITVPNGLTAMIGPSGCGKSSLLAVIAGFLTPVSGSVLWQGTAIHDHLPGQRPLSILFQDHNLFPHLTVAQNVGLGLRPDLKLSAAEHGRVRAVLEQTGLSDLHRRKPRALSGGQQSRVALARALLRDQPVLLLDEPFSALGPSLRLEMLGLVSAMIEERGTTVLMVTHDPQDALHAADHTILIDEGRVTQPHPTRALFENPPPALKDYLG